MGVGGPPRIEPGVPTILGLKEGDGHWEGQGWEGPTEKNLHHFVVPPVVDECSSSFSSSLTLVWSEVFILVILLFVYFGWTGSL